MSVRIMSMVLDVKLGSPARKVVALKLADHADDKGERVFPSVANIAGQCELSERTVQYTLREFVDDLKILVVVRRANGAPGVANEYKFDLNKLQSFPKSYEGKFAKTRSKQTGAKSAPLRNSASTGANDRKTGATDDINGCSPCTLTIKEPSKNHPSSRAREKSSAKQPKRRHEEGRAIEDLKKEVRAIEAKPSPTMKPTPVSRAHHVITRNDVQWKAWLSHYDSLERWDILEGMEATGKIATPTKWPPSSDPAE